jgi:hypothetical protein
METFPAMKRLLLLFLLVPVAMPLCAAEPAGNLERAAKRASLPASAALSPPNFPGGLLLKSGLPEDFVDCVFKALGATKNRPRQRSEVCRAFYSVLFP